VQTLNAARPFTAIPPQKSSPLRFLDWIWHIRGTVPLGAGQSSEDAFGRLDPLFEQPGTTRARSGDTLTFEKKNQLAQDKLSVFDSGVLQFEQAAAGPVLRYHLVSRALLFCFLAPLLFLGVAQLTVALGERAKPTAEEEAKADAKEKAKRKDKEAELQLNPVDKLLGAPAPEKPKDEKGKKKEKDKEESPKGFSPTPAYVFAAIFAALYVLGRILESWLIKRLFAKALA
jgi:hypothetical protein